MCSSVSCHFKDTQWCITFKHELNYEYITNTHTQTFSSSESISLRSAAFQTSVQLTSVDQTAGYLMCDCKIYKNPLQIKVQEENQ